MYVVIDCEWNRPQNRSLLKKNKRGCVLNSELMQIGAVRLDEAYETTDTFSCNIKPIAYKIIHPDVLKLTRIDRKDLVGAPHFKEVWKKFEEFLKPDDTLITWGPSDKKVILNNLNYWEVEHSNLKFMDLQAVVDGMFFDDKQHKSLQYVLDYLDLEQCPRGDIAINDAIDTATIFRYISQLPPEDDLEQDPEDGE